MNKETILGSLLTATLVLAGREVIDAVKKRYYVYKLVKEAREIEEMVASKVNGED